jgi:hypothetical protein
LCAKSPFFQQILKDSKEIYPGVLRYEMDANIDAFSLVVEWLYRGSISHGRPATSLTTLHPARFVIRTRIDLYMLAEDLEIKDLADKAMEDLGVYYSLNNLLPSMNEFDLVFMTARTGSAIHKYMTKALHFTLVGCPHTEITGNYIGEHDATTTELWHLISSYERLGMYIIRRMREGQPAAEKPCSAFICSYHNHGPDYPCKLRGKRFRDFKEPPSIAKVHALESPAPKPLPIHRPLPNILGPATPGRQDLQKGSKDDGYLGSDEAVPSKAAPGEGRPSNRTGNVTHSIQTTATKNPRRDSEYLHTDTPSNKRPRH